MFSVGACSVCISVTINVIVLTKQLDICVGKISSANFVAGYTPSGSISSHSFSFKPQLTHLLTFKLPSYDLMNPEHMRQKTGN